MAFAATSKATGLTKAGQLPIVVNGQVLSNPYEMTGKDSGNTTGFFPIYYFNQALAKIGFTATWDGTTHTWAITAPGVTPTAVAGGVGTGNTTVTVNGTVVKKFNTQVAKDPAGGKNAQATTYLPIYYIQNVLSALGVKGSFSGQTGLSITHASTSVPGQGNISAPSISGEAVGSGTEASPAVSYGDPLTISTTVTDANGNPIAGVNAVLDLDSNGQGGAPTVTANGASVAPSSSTNGDFQYSITTDSNGVATAQVTVSSGTSNFYTVRWLAPFNQNGTNNVVKSSKAYVQFIAANKLGIAPGNNFQQSVSTSSNSDAGLTPVTVTVPPNSETPQQGVAVTFTISGNGFFATSSGGSLGTGAQTVYTDANGQATVYVDSTSTGVTTVQAETSQYGEISTSIDFEEAGLVSQVDNTSATGYQQSGTATNSYAGSNDSFQANLGNNVTFQATAEDQNGNPVANAQLLIVNSVLDTSGANPSYAPQSSAHGNYVNGTTTTAFPNVNPLPAGVDQNTNPSTLGEVVTSDASGNFSFTVNDNEANTDQYFVYAVQGGTVTGDPIWAPIVQWSAGTTVNYIGVNGSGGPLKYDVNDVSGIVSQASLTYEPNQLPIVRFEGFGGKDAPVTVGLNQNYTITASGEADASIWGIRVDDPKMTTDSSGNPIEIAGFDTLDQSNDDNSHWYQLVPNTASQNQDSPVSQNRGVGSVTVRLEANTDPQGNVTSYEVYVNGQDIGSQTLSTGPVVEFAGADDDNGNVKYTITSQKLSATAEVTFNGGQPYETEGVTPEVTLSNGQSENLSFTLEDINGNPIANTLGTITFDDSQNLWVTKINGSQLTANESGGSNGNSSAPEPTPIPLWNVEGPNEQALVNGALGYTSVNESGIGSWTPNFSTSDDAESQTIHAYSDANGVIMLTLQDGAPSYWSSVGGGQVVTAPSASGSEISETFWSPIGSDATNPPAQLVVSAEQPNGYTNEGTLTFQSTDGSTTNNNTTVPSGSGSGSQTPAGAPKFSSVATATDGSTVKLTFNKALNENVIPANSAFDVEDNGKPDAVTNVAISGSTVTLTLTTPLATNDVATVAYNQPAANGLQDAAGDLVSTFAAKSIDTSSVASN
ncbi:hypothetical protein AAC03nite_04950 [Alicyclobacillus acidoterrestris]|nr:hypothetical protein AAC03nite_04950 [Alicyclobacillus acidoterrestris]